ncbi:hypothetical protein GCM10022383_27260 [Microbacterium soli]|uniref:Uncharacterized protein n=1 Tax=Microbacterium soli TaxID=446075 RepID=A0ABP7NK75_9MICO
MQDVDRIPTVNAHMFGAYDQEMNRHSPSDDDSDRRATDRWADDGGTPAFAVIPPEPSTSWVRAVARHWHPYAPTQATQDRAAEVKRARALKPRDIPSQSPDPRG